MCTHARLGSGQGGGAFDLVRSGLACFWRQSLSLGPSALPLGSVRPS